MASHASVSVADLKDIQAGPLVGVPTKATTFIFFSIHDPTKFRHLLKVLLPFITTSEDARKMRNDVWEAKAAYGMYTLASVNVSFSQRGLAKLQADADPKDPSFSQGQLKRAPNLGDDTAKWLPVFKDNPIDGLFEVTGNPAEHILHIVEDKIKVPFIGHAITVIFEHHAHVRPGAEKGHEHFGFNDGISQPYVIFQDDAQRHRAPLPGQNTVNPGVLVHGQPGDPITRPAWTKNGSFAVYRHLKQLVPEFNDFLKSVVLSSITVPPAVPGSQAPHSTGTDSEDFQKRVDFLGARLMGRWKSGMPVVLSPKPPKDFPVDNPAIGKDPKRNNNFDYGPRDPSNPRKQFLCPFAAHTRKTGPRTDLPQAAIETRVINRGGITFGPEVQLPQEAHRTVYERGLSFVSYQSTLANGFEFIQQSWVNNTNFPPNTGGVTPGFDPIIGQHLGQPRSMTGYDADNLTKSLTIPSQFIIAQGGEYFFLPSLTLLHTLAKPA